MSGNDYGGKCTMALSSGERISLRGSVKHSPTGVGVSSVTNQDGTLDRVVELKPKGAEFTFADRGLDYEKLMASPRFDVTWVEEFTGITHLYSQAFWVGDLTIDRGTGEVTGMKVDAEQYIRKGR